MAAMPTPMPILAPSEREDKAVVLVGNEDVAVDADAGVVDSDGDGDEDGDGDGDDEGEGEGEGDGDVDGDDDGDDDGEGDVDETDEVAAAAAVLLADCTEEDDVPAVRVGEEVTAEDGAAASPARMRKAGEESSTVAAL